jgi:hypothetical protein
VELAFSEHGRVLMATFSCEGAPESLKDGGQGWFRKSRHFAWRCGWELQAQCSITVPKEDYGNVRPPTGTQEYNLGAIEGRVEPWDVGDLVISDRLLSARVIVPDCLHLQRGRAIFSWNQPILFGEQMFHCNWLLKAHGPKDGSYLQLRKATCECARGFEFMSPNEEVLGRVCDSEKPTGRGRCERILETAIEHGIRKFGTRERDLEILLGGGNIYSFRHWIEGDPRIADFDAYVDSHSSRC